MENGEGNTSNNGGSNNNSCGESKELYCSSWWSQFRNVSNPWMARYVYGFIFLVANLWAWAARDELTSLEALTQMKGLRGCKVGKDCLGADGVLRVSFGCFLFFMIMYWSTAGTSKLKEGRDRWHSGWWLVKIVLWVAITIFPFYLPSEFIEVYGQVAHFGAGVFLLIQLISIISFIRWLNDYFITEKYAERCQIQVMLFATSAYLICLVGVILMYICEPAGNSCVAKAGYAYETDWQSIISFVVAILAIVIATFSTGIDSKCFQFRKEDAAAEEEDDIPYGYGFFHFVFATGAMYFAMLLIGWNSHHSMKKWTIDVGWTSAYVRIVNEWLAACVYLWMLLAPIIRKSRQSDST
ncbi:hypothetical protein PIB30_093873 [Stylosanthes scabra]|uniref:Serine incorporator n=1 Tax=Stylosanthes scabra TaxID=79078 RepID=A0ABU6YU72_9FABA|nr:hypothetical protein [Stylosanthes scabra]